LTITEVTLIRDAARKKERERQRFDAMLHKGVNLDEQAEGVPTFEEIKRRAEAKNRGISEEAYELGEIGIQIIEE
jgi:hypothetical protein